MRFRLKLVYIILVRTPHLPSTSNLNISPVLNSFLTKINIQYLIHDVSILQAKVLREMQSMAKNKICACRHLPHRSSTSNSSIDGCQWKMTSFTYCQRAICHGVTVTKGQPSGCSVTQTPPGGSWEVTVTVTFGFSHEWN